MRRLLLIISAVALTFTGVAYGQAPIQQVADALNVAELRQEIERKEAYIERLEGDVHRQASRAERNERIIRQKNKELRARWRPQIVPIIELAAVAYGQNPTRLVRKADCETGGTFSPFAANKKSSARGLFQFLTTPNGGTWATTPFGRFSVFNPIANALAAAWMHKVGRGGEWVCQ